MASELDRPVEIAADTFWVGRRDPTALFHQNPYLRVFRDGHGAITHSVLVDPGAPPDLGVVTGKVAAVLGDFARLTHVFLNHQDPDVAAATPEVLARAPHATALCSEDTFRLVVHTGVPRARFVATERWPDALPAPVASLVPVPSPYCHFRGAVMLFDPSTGVLFSGDLFGGVTAAGAVGLDADETDWPGLRAFHQIYMPANVAIRRVLARIERLSPEVTAIAPQHGRILRGPAIRATIDRLASLPVGLDILDEEDADALARWNEVFDVLLAHAREALGPRADGRLSDDVVLADTLDLEAGPPHVEGLGRWTVERALETLCREAPLEVGQRLCTTVLEAAAGRALPAPRVRLEGEPAPRD